MPKSSNQDAAYPLDRIFSTASAVKVLRVLAASELDLSGRQVGDLAGLNPQTTQNTLDRLDEAGLLSVRRVGRAKLYRYRPGNPLVEGLLAPLFAGERRIVANQVYDIIGDEKDRT